MFIHHPDGMIMIEEAVFSQSFFESQEPGYALPSGAIGRRYVPGKIHHVTKVNANGEPFQDDGGLDEDLLWPEGDGYIVNKQTYLDAWAEQNKPTIEEIAADKIATLNVSATNAINSGFTSDALGTTHAYDSQGHNREWVQAASAVDVDTLITCDDLQSNPDSKQPRTHTPAQALQVLKDGMAALLIQKNNFRTKRDEIHAIVADDVTYPDYDSKVAAIEAITW